MSVSDNADSVYFGENDEEETVVSGEDIEYLTQYLGFQPSSFLNGMYNAMIENLKEAITTLSKGILEMYKDKISESELKEVIDNQAQINVERLDKLFDKAESYLMCNVFCLPKNFTFPEDRAQIENPCSEDQMNDLDHRLGEVKDKIIAVKYANSILQKKMSEIEKLQKKLDSILQFAQRCHDKVTEDAGHLQKNAADMHEVLETIQKFDSLMLKTT